MKNKFHRLVLWLTFMFIPYTYIFGSGIDLGHKNGMQYHPFVEWSLSNQTFSGNPYDINGLVVFTHSSGTQDTTAMFYGQDSIWNFRFAGKLIGDWSLITQSDDVDLDGHFGTISISENTNANVRGFLKGDQKWYWEENMQAVIPNYVMYHSDVTDYLNNPVQIQNDIDEFMVDHGFSGFHVENVGGRWFQHDRNDPDVYISDENPDPATFEALELLIKMTYESGGMVHIWAWGDEARSWTPTELAGGINGIEDRRLQRYIAARLGPIPGWSMGYGFDLDEWVDLPELDSWQNFMKENCGWFHYFGGRFHQPNSGTNHNNGIDWNEAMDYSAWEHHKPTYEVYRAALTTVDIHPTMSEDRFRIRLTTRPKDFNVDGSDTRRTLWYGAMAGGVAGIWANLQNMGSGMSFPYPNKEEIKTFSTFFNQAKHFYLDSQPDSTLNASMALFSPTQETFVVYQEATDEIYLNLSDLSTIHEIKAVDTRAAYIELILGQFSDTTLTITLPDSSDWALIITPADSMSSNIQVDLAEITLFPNPVNNFLTIRGLMDPYELSILDVNGMNYQTINTSDTEGLILDFSILPQGLYFIQVKHEINDVLFLRKILKE